MGSFSYQNGRQSQKMGKKKRKISTLMDLNCLKTAKKPECYAHSWKAYLIGYNFVIQKIALKYNPDFSRFFC